MICPPYGLSRPDRYCRLLPPFQHSGDPAEVETRLKDLAGSMIPTQRVVRPLRVRPGLPLADEARPGMPPAAAYTYFGQFIVHDLTFDDTPFRVAGVQDPEETVNYRTPWLDLESLYGDGPGSAAHGHLYAGDSFLLGAAGPTGVPFDVPLKDGVPAVADPRNCENALVRQVHAMFLLLHNLIVSNLEARVPHPPRLFETARSYVRWHFQRLVRREFLKKVCNREVYTAVIGKSDRLIHWPWGRFSIPVEFSQAAARFGHSMVKEEYDLSATRRGVSLTGLLLSARGEGALLLEHAVDWIHFLSPVAQPAESIDTTLPNHFKDLPDANIHPFVTSSPPHEPNVLALRTLCRGARTRLPTGQQMRAALDPDAVISPGTGPLWDNLRERGFENEIPLWYYVLLEAEINESGNTLGEIGSRIVAEVIEASLRHDRSSFLYCGGGEWFPPIWMCADGKKRTVETFGDLAIAVGLAKPLQ
jgi:hypothetical protein